MEGRCFLRWFLEVNTIECGREYERNIVWQKVKYHSLWLLAEILLFFKENRGIYSQLRIFDCGVKESMLFLFFFFEFLPPEFSDFLRISSLTQNALWYFTCFGSESLLIYFVFNFMTSLEIIWDVSVYHTFRLEHFKHSYLNGRFNSIKYSVIIFL